MHHVRSMLVANMPSARDLLGGNTFAAALRYQLIPSLPTDACTALAVPQHNRYHWLLNMTSSMTEDAYSCGGKCELSEDYYSTCRPSAAVGSHTSGASLPWSA